MVPAPVATAPGDGVMLLDGLRLVEGVGVKDWSDGYEDSSDGYDDSSDGYEDWSDGSP
jgi:hypothetical protein